MEDEAIAFAVQEEVWLSEGMPRKEITTIKDETLSPGNLSSRDRTRFQLHLVGAIR